MEHRAILNRAIAALFSGALLASTYAFDNVNDHPRFNEVIVEQFVEQVQADASNVNSRFSRYLFVMNGNAKLAGTGVADKGWTSVNEAEMKLAPTGWIKHGGFAADEPEMPAGVRHFYDPLGIDGGKKWLTDISGRLETLIRDNITGDPQIDAKEWAFSYAENQHNWAIGKAAFKKALEEDDPALREKYMAKAWRCLGEVLHLVADMGLPPHVRNDTHPSSGSGAVDYMFGDPGPCESLFKTDYISDYKSNKAEVALKDAFAAATTAEAIFDTLARFTNRHFFSAGTIMGTGSDTYSPLITSRPAYPLPKLEDLDYHDEDFYFYKKFPSGTEVKLCRDLRFIKRRGYPYIDSKCVQSMSAVWVPSVITAGKYVMARFIPKLSVTITDYDASSGSYKGTIDHTTDNEYISGISYNGPVVITDGSFTKIDTAECDGGYFEGKLTKPVAAIGAEISFGGITITGQISQAASGTFSLVTRPERVYAHTPCTLVVTGTNLPKGYGTGFSLIDSIENGGYYSDTSFFTYQFGRSADYQVEATVYYNNSSRIWKVDTFTVSVNDTIIIDSLSRDSAYAGYDNIGIYGRYFGDTGTVFINGKESAVLSWNNNIGQASSIFLRIPLMVDTTATISIAARNATSAEVTLKIVPPSKIEELEPKVWQYPGSASIRGSNFGKGGTTYDEIRLIPDNESGAMVYRFSLLDVWSDTLIAFKVAPAMRTGRLFVTTRTGTSDTVPVKVVPNMSLMNSVTFYLVITGCSFVNQTGVVSTNSITYGFSGILTAKSTSDVTSRFDSSYTVAGTAYTISQEISFSLDSSLERIGSITIERQTTSEGDNGWSDVRGDTIVIDGIAQPLSFRVGADTLTGYSMKMLNADTLLGNIKELRSQTYTITTTQTGNEVRYTRCNDWPKTKPEGGTAYITFDIKR